MRSEAAKKAKKRAKNQRAVATQCELSYLEDAAPTHSRVHQAHTFAQDHSRIPSADGRAYGGHAAPVAPADHGWPSMGAAPHSGKVVPAVMRHNVPQVCDLSLPVSAAGV